MVHEYLYLLERGDLSARHNRCASSRPLLAIAMSITVAPRYLCYILLDAIGSAKFHYPHVLKGMPPENHNGDREGHRGSNTAQGDAAAALHCQD